MAIMGKPVWAVMCGAIRQDFELYATAAMLCGYRAEGMIDGIVVSTWTGEPDNIPGLREKLERLGIDVVESGPIDEALGRYTNLNFARQEYQLKAGLDHLPDDVFVLKCRTDFSEQNIKVILENIRGPVDLSIGEHGAWSCGLNYRIVVSRFPVTRAFWLIDRGFVAYKPDMLKMLAFENTMLKYGTLLEPDIAFFLDPFVNEYPVLGEMLKLTRNSYLVKRNDVLTQRLKKYYGKHEEEMGAFSLPAAYNKFYALYFVLLRNCFYLAAAKKKKIGRVALADVFLGSRNIGMVSDATCPSVFSDPELLRVITEGGCVPTEGYLKLYREIDRLKWPGYAQRTHITREDYLEACEWTGRYLALDPTQVLSWDGVDAPASNNTGFFGAMDRLFSEYRLTEGESRAFRSVMYDVCFDPGRHFYKALTDRLHDLDGINGELLRSALPAAARSEIPSVLERCAADLYEGNVPPDRVGYYRYIFERYDRSPGFFFKMPKIASLYYYAKFSEAEGSTRFSQDVYDVFSRVFAPVDAPKDASYAELLVEVLAKAANERYGEYASNADVRSAIDFLYDKFPDRIAKEAAAYLAPYFAWRKYARPFLLGEADAFPRLLSAAERAKDRTEAECVLGLLLREKSAQEPETRERADRAIRTLTERFALPDTCLLRADRLGTGEIFEADPAEIATDEQFVTLLRLLADKKDLAANRERLAPLCGENGFRRLALAVFERLETTEELGYAALKTAPRGNELWLVHRGYMRSGFDERLVHPRADNGVPWPNPETALPSCLGAFFRLERERLVFSVQFAAGLSRDKELLLGDLAGQTGAAIDTDLRCVSLLDRRYPAERPETLRAAVDGALDGFCEIGRRLSLSAARYSPERHYREEDKGADTL